MAKVPAAPRRSLWDQIRKRWQLLAFLALPLAYLIIFCYVPMIDVQIAFRRYLPAYGVWNSEWVGFANFTKFFKSFQFSRVVGNTIKISLYSLAVNFPLAIIFSLMFNVMRAQKLKKVAQMIMYVPHFISVVVLVGMIIQLSNPVVGLYGNLYRLFAGPGTYPSDPLGNPNNFIHIYVWTGVWQGLGWSTIIYIAALSGVDPGLHEAAEIDGATRLQRVFHVDLPCILPTASIMLILNAGNVMSVGFEKVYLLQNNLNLMYSETISTYVYKTGMSGGGTQFSYATAIGLFNSVINFVLLLIVNKTASKLEGGSSLW